ncbi:cold-shock protein [Rhizobium sp.]|uniref:cold-shock protein n=1 Tax=Rhizobium sp. TaxID=391 RepID=UPI0034C63555
MQNRQYRVGDTLLKRGVLGPSRPSGRGRIVCRLPDSQGSVQYHVRLDSENFERRILQMDIDVAASPPSLLEKSSPREGKPSNWLDSHAIRIKKN